MAVKRRLLTYAINTDAPTKQVTRLRQEFAKRLRRHDDCTYIYTYPFKGAYRPLADGEAALQAWALASGPLNIYVHIPYCDMKCSFCNLFTTTQHTADTIQRYTRAVLEEARLLARQVDWGRFEVDSLYFGGGTPTLLSLAELNHLIHGLRDLFPFRSTAEMAIESAPNSIDEKKLRDLWTLGFRRMSFGLQSFQDDELSAMGRSYESGLGSRMATAAIAAGFVNVNVDLIFGLPNQSAQTWMRNLETTVSLGVKTVTIYPLTLRSRTRFGKTYETTPQDFQRGAHLYSLYDIAVDFLSSHGYQQHSTAAFAKPGGGCRHEANEFNGIPTLGLGVAALSYAPTVHYTSGRYFEATPTARILGEYLDAIDRRELPIDSGIALDRDELQRRHVILGLLYSGVDRDEYRTRFDEPLEARFDLELEVLRSEGCIDERGKSVALSQRGRRFSSLAADLLASDSVKRLSTSYR